MKDIDLKEQMEENMIKHSRSRLNERERDRANQHCFNTYPIRFGKICCSHCKKTITDLEITWKAKQHLSGKSTERTRPYLTIQEKNGRGLDSIDSITSEVIPFGNIDWACYSCQQKFYTVNDSILPDSKSSYQARKGKPVRRKFKIRLSGHLAKHGEVCYKAIINKWSGESMYDCSQDLLESAFDSYLNVIWIFLDVIPCEYPKCNGKHVILMDSPTPKVSTDYEAYLDEHDENRDV